MSRPRTPTAKLEATGAFAINPQRKKARENEPKPEAPCSLAPPSHLKANEKKVWLELIGKLAKGVAFNSDEASFEVLVCLFAEFRERRRKGIPQPVGEYAAMNKLFSQFAMTPADRSRVNAPKGSGKPKDEFDEWDKANPAVQ